MINKTKNRFLIVFICILLLFSSILSSCGNSKNAVSQTSAKDLSVVFVDVGQGDSFFLKTPDGKFILVDCGNYFENPEQLNKVTRTLKNAGCEEIELVVFTHPHSDHISGNYPIFTNFKINKIFFSGVETNTYPYQKLLVRINDSGAEASTPYAGESLNIGEIQIDVIGPFEDMVEGANSDSSESLNNCSIGLKFTYGNFKLVACGDAEEEEEARMVEKYGNTLSAAVLKCGHHGSSTSTSDTFLKAVSPSYAVISCGVKNDYGHPHVQTLSKLQAANISSFRTDLNGDITIQTDGENISISTEK